MHETSTASFQARIFAPLVSISGSIFLFLPPLSFAFIINHSTHSSFSMFIILEEGWITVTERRFKWSWSCPSKESFRRWLKLLEKLELWYQTIVASHWAFSESREYTTALLPQSVAFDTLLCRFTSLFSAKGPRLATNWRYCWTCLTSKHKPSWKVAQWSKESFWWICRLAYNTERWSLSFAFERIFEDIHP